MRKFITALATTILTLLFPVVAHATAITWDAVPGSITQPLQSRSLDRIRVNYVTGTSTTATSSFPVLQATSRFLGAGLSSCSGATNALIWSASTWQFGCNTIVDTSFSTTSAAYFSSLGLSFSTTSALAHLNTIDKGYFFSSTSANAFLNSTTSTGFSTTSASYFSSLGLAHSTTSANYSSAIFIHGSTTIPKTYTANTYSLTQTFTLAPIFTALTGIVKGNGASAATVAVNGTDFTLITLNTCTAGTAFVQVTAAGIFTCGNAFSTTSAAYFSSVGLAFSTTSADYLQTQRNYFSTTSASYFSSLGLAFSTTSALAHLNTLDKGYFYSTSSENYYQSASPTVATMFKSNVFTGTNAFQTITATGATTTTLTVTSTASTSKFYADGLVPCTGSSFLQWTGGVFGCGVASAGAAASTTLLIDTNTWSGSNFFQKITATGATTTSLSTAIASTTDLWVSGISLCTGANALQTNAAGKVACGAVTGDGMFSTTSAAYFASVGLAYSTTSTLADLNTYSKGFFFSTTSASYFSSLGLAWSTTSASAFLALNQGNAFSTTSANYHALVGLAHSTTSVAYQLTQPTILGNSTSTNFGITNALTITGAGTSTLGNAAMTRFSFTATSTGSQGINLTGGCFAINGTCLSTSGGASATNNQIVYGTGSGITSSGNMTYDGTTVQFTGSGTNNTLKVVGTSAVSSGLYFQNTQTTGQAVMYVDNDRGSFASYGGFLQGSQANAIGNLFGVSRADRTFVFADGANSLGLVLGTLTAQPLIFGTNNTEWMRVVTNGSLGLGSTTPWAQFSILDPKTTALDYATPVFAAATSTDAFGFLGGIWATTTGQVMTASRSGYVFDSGARWAIGTSKTFDYPGLLDQLTVNGRINTLDWMSSECLGISTGGSIISSAVNACGQWNFRVDSSGSLSVPQNGFESGGIFEIRMCPTSLNTGSCTAVASAAGQGAGLFYPGSSNASMALGTTTPVFEINFRRTTQGTNSAATSTSIYMGFLNTSVTGTSFEVEPTAGCYLAATTTTGITSANWLAICRTSAAAVTTVDTGFASSTVLGGTGASEKYTRLRIEAGGTEVRFFMSTSSASMRMVARITTNIPASETFLLNAGIIIANTAANTPGQGIKFNRIKVSYQQPVLNY